MTIAVDRSRMTQLGHSALPLCMRKRTDRLIGIVAVNKAQSDLIEGMMDELAGSDPDIQAYRQHWDGTLEAFFVKNLENVQGR